MLDYKFLFTNIDYPVLTQLIKGYKKDVLGNLYLQRLYFKDKQGIDI